MTKPKVVSNIEDRKEACSTFIEQTKQLISLASAFLLGPAGFVSLKHDWSSQHPLPVCLFLTSEALFIASVLVGYFVLGSIAGSQDEGTYDVYRPATRILSLLQIGCYLVGMGFFVGLILAAV